MSKIVILGSGPSLSLYKYDKDDIIYCPYCMKSESFNEPNIVFFEMHKGMEPDGAIVCQNNYPLGDIIEKYKSTYFTNTISYIIAYCLFFGVEEIDLHGVDMIDINDSSEYISQRGSVMFWIGMAEGLGVKVNTYNGIMEPFLYGYEDKKKVAIIKRIDFLKKHAQNKLKLSDNEAGQNQYIGFIHALDMLRGDL